MCLASIAVIGWPVTGLLLGEDVRGNFAYGLIVGAILIDATLLFAIGTTSDIQRLVRVCWVLFCVLVGGFSIYLIGLNDPDAYKAADTLLLVAMGILAFPMGIAAIVLVFFYSSIFLATSQTSVLDLVAFWLMFIAVGYVQWFLALPWLLRWFRERRLKGAYRALR